jgi:SAM-dependent methyltransferase
MREFWDDRYGSEEFIYGTAPNEWFALHLQSLPPGRALFPAEGEGRNAVYAAEKGWTVDAFDFSESAALKAGKLAREHGVGINYDVCGWEEFAWPEAVYDLVVLSYVHMDPESRKAFHKKVYQSLKPGGTLILEAFSPEQLNYSSGGPKNPEWLFTPGDLESDFSGLNISHLNKETVILREGEGHSGEASVVRMLALKP